MNPYETAMKERLERALGDAYVLEKELGRGGFAIVYAATDGSLKRKVAIKVLRPELVEVAGARERFRREAEAVAALRHPHIIPIYAVGDSADLAYFVMPFVEGGSLADRLLKDARLPVSEAHRILREAAAGLAVAHRAGVIHRDIKPDNILLDGPDRRVVLTDFGIAKAVGGDQRGLTQTGAVVGTPHYMSPEQASGEQAIDGRSDLYSLGIVGYQMLTGQVPFNGMTLAAVLVHHLTTEAPPVTRSRPDCPAPLSAAVARCLVKAPEERWASAEDLLRALDAVADSATTPVPHARRSSAASSALLAPVQRFRAVLGAWVGAAVLLNLADVATHRVLLGPPGAIVALFVVAAAYGKLWTAGFTWRDVLAREVSNPARASSPVPLDSAELGPHQELIRQARSDRAGMLAAIQRLPRAERQGLSTVVPTVDALLARLAEEARHLHAVERQFEPGPEEITRRLAETRSEAASPGREQRLGVLARRLITLKDLAERRDRLAVEVTKALAAVTRIRAELDRVVSTGLNQGQDLRSALKDAETLLQGPATTV